MGCGGEEGGEELQEVSIVVVELQVNGGSGLGCGIGLYRYIWIVQSFGACGI